MHRAGQRSFELLASSTAFSISNQRYSPGVQIFRPTGQTLLAFTAAEAL